MNTKINYLSKENQAKLIPNSTAVKYHNASFNKNSKNREWLVDVSCYNNKKGTFYNLLNIHEKINPMRFEANYEFSNKKDALEFIKAVNGKLTKFDRNFKARSVRQDSNGVWRWSYSRTR
jgi:hypothetical protein|tara:strand:+ start:7863 stop:8222 length:360 start_codon:yes stop_codon:yes gene_type:complete